MIATIPSLSVYKEKLLHLLIKLIYYSRFIFIGIYFLTICIEVEM